MSQKKTAARLRAGSRPWSTEEHLKNPAVRAAYDALEDEFGLVRQLIDLRQEQGLSQRQLARRAGMQQPTIARLEGGRSASIGTLRKVAAALNAQVEVRLVTTSRQTTVAFKKSEKGAVRFKKSEKDPGSNPNPPRK